MAKKHFTGKKKSFYASKEFKALQTEWYHKLKQEGFDDIEWYDERTGYGQNSRFMKYDTGALAYTFDENSVAYYRLTQIYASHGTFSTKIMHKLWNLHADGAPMRKIVTVFRAEYASTYKKLSNWIWKTKTLTPREREMVRGDLNRLKKKAPPFSLFWVHYHLKRMRVNMMEFHHNHPEGEFYEG